jgi:hypothetical protein
MLRSVIRPLRESASVLRPLGSLEEFFWLRKLLGLGEDCAVQIGFAVVRVKPSSPAAFWDIARRAMADLAEARTRRGIRACCDFLHQTVLSGLDVPAVAGLLQQGLAHDILLLNLGNLRYETGFGELRLRALWGPAAVNGAEKMQTIGVATTDGVLRLLHSSCAPIESLLEVTEQILISACAHAG